MLLTRLGAERKTHLVRLVPHQNAEPLVHLRRQLQRPFFGMLEEKKTKGSTDRQTKKTLIVSWAGSMQCAKQQSGNLRPTTNPANVSLQEAPQKLCGGKVSQTLPSKPEKRKTKIGLQPTWTFLFKTTHPRCDDLVKSMPPQDYNSSTTNNSLYAPREPRAPP